MEIPKIGSTIEILSIKHNKKLHRKWKKNIVLYSDIHQIIGGNYKTIVEEASGDIWKTEDRAIFYFDRRFWFNIIVIFKNGTFFYYCNMSSPFTFNDNCLQYIDYDIDVIVQSNFTYNIVDQDEYEVNKEMLNYPPEVQRSISNGLNQLLSWIDNRRSPFHNDDVDKWFNIFLQYD